MNLNRIASVLAVLALAGGLAACGGAAAETQAAAGTVAAAEAAGHVDAETFLAAAVEEGVTVIDVRTPTEFASGHLDGAVNIDVESADFASRIAELDPQGAYAVYCRSGNRSRVAEQMMRDAGFVQVVGLEGGVSALDPSLLVTD